MKKAARLLLVFLLLVALWYWQNRTIQTEALAIALPELPQSFSGLRIVQVSDLHGSSFGKDNCRLIAAVAEQEPDLIAITGDLADTSSDLEAMLDTAQALCAIAPVYYVSGNHEWTLDAPRAFFAELEARGVIILANDYRVLTCNGEEICIAGVHDPNGPYDMCTPEELVAKIRSEQGDDACILMLAHRNDQLERWSAMEVPLVLCGHGHGGVIRLPGFGGLLGVDRTFLPDYTAGIYTKEDTTMMVSRGLGNSVIPFRLGNRPHLPVIVLQSAK